MSKIYISMLHPLFYMTRHNVLQCGILLSMHNTRKGQFVEPIATGILLPPVTIFSPLQHREITLYRRCVWERGSKPSVKLPQCWKPPNQAIPGVIEGRLLAVRLEFCLQLWFSSTRCCKQVATVPLRSVGHAEGPMLGRVVAVGINNIAYEGSVPEFSQFMRHHRWCSLALF